MVMATLKIVYPKGSSDKVMPDEYYSSITYEKAIEIMNNTVESIPEARFEMRYNNHQSINSELKIFNWHVGRFVTMD